MACGHPYYAETSGRFAVGFTALPTDTPKIQFQPRMRGT
jgi:hypothetical protein